MQINVTDAKDILVELFDRAEAGEQIVLTGNGDQTVRLVPVKTDRSTAERKSLIESVRARAALRQTNPIPVADSQDFLYGDDGLPG
jgi:prevent-host-death family protein